MFAVDNPPLGRAAQRSQIYIKVPLSPRVQGGRKVGNMVTKSNSARIPQ
jgi:hypothetical protein